MNNIYFSISESLEFFTILQSVFVVLYLLITSSNKKFIIIPIIYFIILSLDSSYSILPNFINFQDNPKIHYLILMSNNLIVPVGFLLICQFILNRTPPFYYWIIILVPLIASTPFVHALIHMDQLCIDIDLCFSVQTAYFINYIILSSAIYFWLVIILVKYKFQTIEQDRARDQKYWLIIALIIFNTLLLLTSLLLIKDVILYPQYLISKSLIKLSFIYMVLSCIFRVYIDIFDINHLKLNYAREKLTNQELELIPKIEKLLSEDKIFNDIEMNRKKFADILQIKEYSLSKIINLQYKKSFSNFLNDYRVKEAKDMLINSSKQITIIGYDVGFNSITSFNRVFKEYTNFSPKEYRKQYKKNE